MSTLSEKTYYRRKSLYGGMKTSELRRLKELEAENARLKKLVADLALDNAILKELLSPARRRQAVNRLVSTFAVSERRACRLTGQSRSTQRYVREIPPDEPVILARMKELVGPAFRS